MSSRRPPRRELFVPFEVNLPCLQIKLLYTILLIQHNRVFVMCMSEMFPGKLAIGIFRNSFPSLEEFISHFLRWRRSQVENNMRLIEHKITTSAFQLTTLMQSWEKHFDLSALGVPIFAL